MLVGAAQQVLSDLPGARAMGLSARARVAQHFSLAAEAAGIAQVYQSLFDTEKT